MKCFCLAQTSMLIACLVRYVGGEEGIREVSVCRLELQPPRWQTDAFATELIKVLLK